REGVVVAFSADDDLGALDALHAPNDLVDLTRVDEHAAHLGDLVGAAAPAQHARRRAAAPARLVGDHREIARAEADHRIRAVVDRRHELADLAVGQRLAPGRMAPPAGRIPGQGDAPRLRAPVRETPHLWRAHAPAGA